MIVMKFGGTSVADQAAIQRLISIVRAARQAALVESQDWRGPVIVVSALGGATDKFLRAAADAGAGNSEGALGILRELRARHLDVASLIGSGHGPCFRSTTWPIRVALDWANCRL